jgi:hypothetical protein
MLPRDGLTPDQSRSDLRTHCELPASAASVIEAASRKSMAKEIDQRVYGGR